MRIVVDRTLCDGNGVCMGIAPEVFEIDDEMVLHVLQENPADELRPQVEQAVISCPKLAISIEEN